jgi:hypothetical protein
LGAAIFRGLINRKSEHALVLKWHWKIGTEGILVMKTKTLIACLATGLLMFGQPARATGNPPAIGLSQPVSLEYRHPARQTHRPAALSGPAVSGVIPRAIRGGNPLQMLNPFAPETYGTAEENVALDPDVPGKGNGIKLLSFSF